MTATGCVRVWHDAQGWGVIDSDLTPGGCWTHFSVLLVPGYKALATGQQVSFRFEAADQDGYSFRAVTAWPFGDEPIVADGSNAQSCAAYSSTLNLVTETIT